MKSEGIIVKGIAAGYKVIFFLFVCFEFQLRLLVYFANCGLLLIFKYHEISISWGGK